MNLKSFGKYLEWVASYFLSNIPALNITNIDVFLKNTYYYWLWVRSPLEEIKYLLKFIFPFLRSGVEAKRGVEFCHLTRNASRIRQKVGNVLFYTRFPLPTLLCAGYSVKLFLILYLIEDNLNCSRTIILKHNYNIHILLKYYRNSLKFSVKFKWKP